MVTKRIYELDSSYASPAAVTDFGNRRESPIAYGTMRGTVKTTGVSGADTMNQLSVAPPSRRAGGG